MKLKAYEVKAYKKVCQFFVPPCRFLIQIKVSIKHYNITRWY